MAKIPVPIFMYHEVAKDLPKNGSSYYMTPNYSIPTHMFEEQIRMLKKYGYEPVTVFNLQNLKAGAKYVFLTFDDGFEGNYRCALSILNKYGFQATFFVTSSLIGTSNYMNWNEVRELASAQMCIQSHGVTHRPFEELDLLSIKEELKLSKVEIEDKVGSEVVAISFPHGSFNRKSVLLAESVGYKYCFTSDVEPTFDLSFVQHPAILGRIAVTSKTNTDRLLQLLQFDSVEYNRLRVRKKATNLFRRLLGINNYRVLYRMYYRIED